MVIANSCAGGFCYSERYGVHKPYDNPFVGCTVFAEDWYNLLKNFQEIDFLDIIGTLDFYPRFLDKRICITIAGIIKVWFIHYNNLEEAVSKWKNRAARMMSKMHDDWLSHTLFVNVPYLPTDSIDTLRKIATEFDIYHQLIVIGSKKFIYDDVNFSLNTYLYTNPYNHYYEISEYIRDKYYKYI